MKSQIKTVSIFYHRGNLKAAKYEKKIASFIRKNYPAIKLGSQSPEVVIALGGDGTILEAARKYHAHNSIIIGLNLGNVGFLASARDEKSFLPSLKNFFSGNYKILERMMISAEVVRKGKTILKTNALNEVVVKNLLGVVELEAKIEDHPIQYVRGTGIMIATATGSTAYNMSAHGPIVMPDIKCLIITEILDHNIPTPSVVVKYQNKISLKILDYRKRGYLSLTKTGRKIDVILISDGKTVFPLEMGDKIVIKSSPNLIRFAELEKHYFFKSLQEKFAFK